MVKIIICVLLVAAGLVFHITSILSDLEKAGEPSEIRPYLKKHKWASINVVLGAYGLFLFAYYAGEMGPIGSLTMGVAANVAAEKLKARAAAKVEQGGP